MNADTGSPELHRRDPNRVSLVLALAIVSLGSLWIVFSKYAVPPLIKSAYHGESFHILNRLISGQSSHPVEEYLSAWSRIRWRILLDFSLIGLVVLLVSRPRFQRALRRPYSTYLYIALAISTAYLLYFSLAGATSASGIHLFFDAHDLMVYFNSSAWIVGKGKLYLQVQSEYPILANLIFGCIRFLSFTIGPLSSDFCNFSWIWISCVLIVFAYLLGVVQAPKMSLGSWLFLLLLAPATLYFSLLRFDIYPAFFSFWGLDYLRKRKWTLAALLLGVCIALKGYALIVVPSFFVFCWYQIGLRPASAAVTVMLMPLIASNFAVFVWGGKEALLAPYKLQVFRGFNGESSFDSLFFLGSQLGISASRIATLKSWFLENHMPKILQSAIGLGACLFRPVNFDRFRDAALLSVLGFMTFSTFYSPQFVLWVIPFLVFTEDRALLFLGILLAWSTYIYFPVSYVIRSEHRTFFNVSILVVTSIRFLMMARLMRKLGEKERHASLPTSSDTRYCQF